MMSGRGPGPGEGPAAGQDSEAGTAGLNVAVVGLGYVGLTTAVGLAALGHRVIGIDHDAARMKSIRCGRVPMHEPGLQAGLEEHGGRMTFAGSIAEAMALRPDIVMIAVQTPGDSGTSFVEEAAREIGRCLINNATVVLRSTAPLGTTRRMGALVAAEHARAVPVAANPEFLVEGRAYEAFLRPDRIVIGVDDAATASLLRRLYGGVNAPLVETDIATAELAKYAANAYLATQISFINEMADLAEAAGADVETVSRVIKLDSRVGQRAYLNPGIGFGGSCLPKDLRALRQSGRQFGVATRVTDAVSSVNDERAARIVARLEEAAGELDNLKVAVWGLAFKGGTNDVRDSPAIAVVQRLIAAGAGVRAYDPLAEANALPHVGEPVLCHGLYDPLDGADALMVLTDCPEFREPDFEAMRERMDGVVIIDGRNVLPAAAAREAGFTYLGAGNRR